MTHIRAGMRLKASMLTVDAVQVEDATTRTTTSGTYANAATGGAFSAAITVPLSGKVNVEMRVTERNSGATNTITSWIASGSTSGSVYSTSDTAALIVAGTDNSSLDLSYLLTGLTAGELLTVTMQHRVSGGTGTIDYRLILLTGCL
ncbi:hypothetical protein [Streptomyces sp. NPDC090022]|uniref:hypothetical protein n=1 Tax=Streptomyces sp. NPDC090022 TaxID=3365920 RepID=UPI003801C03A